MQSVTRNSAQTNIYRRGHRRETISALTASDQRIQRWQVVPSWCNEVGGRRKSGRKCWRCSAARSACVGEESIDTHDIWPGVELLPSRQHPTGTSKTHKMLQTKFEQNEGNIRVRRDPPSNDVSRDDDVAVPPGGRYYGSPSRWQARDCIFARRWHAVATFTALKERTFSATNRAIRSAESSLVSALFNSKQWRNPGDSAGHSVSRSTHQHIRMVCH